MRPSLLCWTLLAVAVGPLSEASELAEERRTGAVDAEALCGADAAGCSPTGATEEDALSAIQAKTIRRTPAKKVRTEVRGEKGTTSFRRFFFDDEGREISPWHDLPLRTEVEGEYWMVTEIPKMTKPKMEAATREPFNPIAQDLKNGKLREYPGPIYWNYGFLPQTWEDPNVEFSQGNVFGDNDPVDMVEIGSRAHTQGEVSRVKVLGALALIDSGELDWKIIAISRDDPAAPELQDIADVEEKMPWVVSGIREWFRWYKTPDGKPLNKFGFGEAPIGRSKTQGVIEETHGYWQRLRSGAVESDLWTGTAQAQAAG